MPIPISWRYRKLMEVCFTPKPNIAHKCWFLFYLVTYPITKGDSRSFVGCLDHLFYLYLVTNKSLCFYVINVVHSWSLHFLSYGIRHTALSRTYTIVAYARNIQYRSNLLTTARIIFFFFFFWGLVIFVIQLKMFHKLFGVRRIDFVSA